MQALPFSKFENYVSNPHPDALPSALRVFKELKDNNTIWQNAQVKEDVKLQRYKVDGDVIPTVRGDGVIEGWSVEEILAVIRSQSCRTVWDDGHKVGMVVERYDGCTFGFWAAQKGFGMLVWPRDFTGIAGCVQDGDKTYYLNISAPMVDVPKFQATHVRGTLSVAGFTLHKVDGENKVNMTYIVREAPHMLGFLSALLCGLIGANAYLRSR
jgi:hypothetical protein